MSDGFGQRGFVKHGSAPGAAAAEAAYLRWLREGSAAVVEVLDLDEDANTLTIEKVDPARPTVDAAREAGIDVFDGTLSGPTAIAFIKGEPVEPAKALRDFAKDNQQLVIKGGVMDGAVLSADGVDKLASLESREVLLAKFAGAMKGSMSKAAALFQAPLSKTVRTAEALRAKVEETGSDTAADA
mgnify:CR=1 FL=1